MPKRIIDGEAIWSSKKLSNVQPARFRAEYTNLLPLALANGVFECEPRLIFTTVYAYNREDIALADVIAMLGEFERAKMLYRWEEQGKTWGYWVGIESRLPEQSKRTRYKNAPVSVPSMKLEEFLTGKTPEPIRTESGGSTLDRIGRDRNGVEHGQHSSDSNSTSKLNPDNPVPVSDPEASDREDHDQSSGKIPCSKHDNSPAPAVNAAVDDAKPTSPSTRTIGFNPYAVEPFDGWTREQLDEVIHYHWEYLPSIEGKSFWRDQTNTEAYFKRNFAKMAQAVKPILPKKKSQSVSAVIRRTTDPECKVCGGKGIDATRQCNLCTCVRFLNSEDQHVSYYDYLCVKQGKRHVDGMGASAVKAYRKLGLPEVA
jgi:hypothetical protein